MLGTAQPKEKNVKGFWEERFNALAVFNAEMARGVMHTAEYTEKMRVMQQEYDAKLLENINGENSDDGYRCF